MKRASQHANSSPDGPKARSKPRQNTGLFPESHPAGEAQAPPIQEQLVELLSLKRPGKEEGKAYLALEQEIWAANGRRHGMKIDRRKLSRIASGEAVTFSLDELQALDNYLAQQGKSLSAVFRRPTILESLAGAERKSVTFLLGSKPIEEFNYLSHWDARAMAFVLRGIERSGRGIRFDVEDIPLQVRATLEERREKLFAQQSWYQQLFDRPDAPSLVCIGSPRASHASEIMLSRMFQVESFRTPAPRRMRGATQSPPFMFVSPPRALAEVVSSFARCSEEYPDRLAGSSDPRWGVGALEVEGDPYWTDWDQTEWREYGVIAVQKRRTGQVWLYVGGVSGPSTYAAARQLEATTATLPEGPLGGHSPVLWMVVGADVRREPQPDGDARGDLRDVSSQAEILSPFVWPRKEQPPPAPRGRPRQKSRRRDSRVPRDPDARG